MMQTISIITPSYNQGVFIEKTIQSVLTQNIIDLEYLVVDGGSTDNTIEILKKYDAKIRWVSEKDKGQTDAVNKGIRQTSGQIIGWLNSDDIYYPDALIKIQQFFTENPDVDIIYGNANHIDVEDKILNAYQTEAWNVENFKQFCFISQPAVFFRRSLVEKYGLLQEDLNYCMDYEYWLRLALAGVKFTWIKETLAATRMHQDTKTLGSRVKVQKEIFKMLKNKIGYIPTGWLRNYAPICLQEKNHFKNGSFMFGVLAGLLTLISSIKWNKSLNKETRHIIYEQSLPVKLKAFLLREGNL